MQPFNEFTLYAVVRRSDEREWLDTSTIASFREIAVRKADEADGFITEWAKANPQVRVATLNVTCE